MGNDRPEQLVRPVGEDCVWKLYSENRDRRRRKGKSTERDRVAAAPTLAVALEEMTPASDDALSPADTTTEEDSEDDEDTWLQNTPEAELRIQQELDREHYEETDKTSEREGARTTAPQERQPRDTITTTRHT